FLLKNGYLPATVDTKEDGALPPELQKLQSFLKAGNTGETFVLQRNATERYCFSWQNNDKLTVTKEECYYAPAGVRTGYVDAEKWRTHTNTPNVEVCLIQQAFKFFTRDSIISFPGFYCDEKKTEMKDSTNRISINERYFSTENKLSFELINQRIDNTIEQIKGKKCSKTFYRENSSIPNGTWFDSCVKDVARAKRIFINDVELEQETFCKIKRAIYGDADPSKVKQVNVSPLNEGTISSILSELKDKKTRDAVEPVLRSPQLPFAVLSGFSQSLASQCDDLVNAPANFAAQLCDCVKNDGLNHNERGTLINNISEKVKGALYDNLKFNISMDNEQNLQCSLTLIFLTGSKPNATDLIMEPYKVDWFYSVPRNFAQGIAQMDISPALDDKLKELMPNMYAEMATLE
ncbi:TPA: hypothetical protein HNO27_24590, partial [Escherichia coli]|nr:hypothetical protein [Escherichia coli]HAJ7257752.1 hypothetical protein [Escherichia coli]HAJ7262582.1 hypothetical protein [Escherichia coli]HBA2641102.1 hypothetical protein [Escherichia coli]